MYCLQHALASHSLPPLPFIIARAMIIRPAGWALMLCTLCLGSHAVDTNTHVYKSLSTLCKALPTQSPSVCILDETIGPVLDATMPLACRYGLQYSRMPMGTPGVCATASASLASACTPCHAAIVPVVEDFSTCWHGVHPGPARCSLHAPASLLAARATACKDCVLTVSTQDPAAHVVVLPTPSEPAMSFYLQNPRYAMRQLLAITDSSSNTTSSDDYLWITPNIAAGTTCALLAVVPIALSMFCLYQIEGPTRFPKKYYAIGKDA